MSAIAGHDERMELKKIVEHSVLSEADDNSVWTCFTSGIPILASPMIAYVKDGEEAEAFSRVVALFLWDPIEVHLND